MINPTDTTLQQTPEALNIICVDISTNIFSGIMGQIRGKVRGAQKKRAGHSP